MKQLLLISLLVVSAACSQKKETKEETSPLEEVRIIEVDSVAGQNEYIVTEEVFWILPEEQEKHLDEAKALHDKKEFKAAADEIRKAGLYIDLELSKAQGAAKNNLLEAKDRLLALGDRLEKGEKVTALELKESFYQINKSLYKNYLAQQQEVASEYDLEKNNVDSHLDAALKRVRNAEKWSGKKLGNESDAIINEGESLSKRIKEKTKEGRETLAKDWNAFLKRLKQLDERLEGDDN